MAPRDLTAALLAVLGVYVLGDSITQVGTTAFFLTLDSSDEVLRQSHTDQGLLTAAFFALQVAFGVCVLTLRHRIAARLFPQNTPPSPGIELSDLQAAALAVLGLYFVVRSFAALAQGVVQLSPQDGLATLWPHYAGTLIQGLLGLALFFGARVASGAWSIARQAGRVR